MIRDEFLPIFAVSVLLVAAMALWPPLGALILRIGMLLAVGLLLFYAGLGIVAWWIHQRREVPVPVRVPTRTGSPGRDRTEHSDRWCAG